MGIKMIAVDMDGTFLDDQKKYNQERFQQLFHQMQEKGIKFVVASGNQYDQLKSFFPDNHKEMSFVAENGANIILEGEHFYNARLDTEVVLNALAKIETLDPTAVVLCGRNSAYVSEQLPEDRFEGVQFYYPSIKRLERFEDIRAEQDEIFKFALSFPNINIPGKVAALTTLLEGDLVPVSSGHGDIDLIIPGVHKAYGLSKLCTAWNISPAELAAFGDSGNDIEMLEYANFSFAVENAQPAVKEAADKIIGTNNQESVLDMIEALL
ncbi:Cof-type HAD-IIB family hydrolase [Enterococcus sp. AZ072]|uniref:Cof-type HAD-IIB family hydrolase n=1 Tax=unclassified Enterococcus TaxID=2608891 RepID=UPI003D285660